MGTPFKLFLLFYGNRLAPYYIRPKHGELWVYIGGVGVHLYLTLRGI